MTKKTAGLGNPRATADGSAGLCSAAMRSHRTARSCLTLSVASTLAISTLPGCAKIEEWMGKKDESSKEGESKEGGEAKEETKSDTPADADAKAADEKKAGEEDAKLADAAPVEAIPVAPPAQGLDLMLELVPDDASQFMIVRDATVIKAYAEEAMRFAEGPLTRLAATGAPLPPELEQMKVGLEQAKTKLGEVTTKLEASGIGFDEGMAFVEGKGGSEYLVFHAADPNALVELVKVFDPSGAGDLKCKKIEGVDGFNVCSDTQARVDAYKPREDSAPLRQKLTDALTGTDLETVNALGSFDEKGEIFVAVSTIPGMVQISVAAPGDAEGIKEITGAVAAGEGKMLGHVAPGAGFIWANVNPAVLASIPPPSPSTPPAVVDFIKSFNGEFLLAGTVAPAGLIFSGSVSDPTKWDGALAEIVKIKDGAVKELQADLKVGKLNVEQAPIDGAGKTVQSLHASLSDLPEAEALAKFAAIHLEGWAFASDSSFVVSVGPNKEGVGKLLEATAGPSEALLGSLPKPLADGLAAKEVAAAVYVPVDFMNSAPMHQLVKSALEEIPDVNPELVLAGLSVMSPLSSGAAWISVPAGKNPVVHFSIQGIGNRETEEGKAALDAAVALSKGTDPATAFGELATKYGASPLAWAYKTRAGTDGPGYLVASGIGAMVAAGAVTVPLFMGVRNADAAEDLGVTAVVAEPVIEPTVVPERPKTEPKPAAPKKPKKPTFKPEEPKPDDPKPDDPKPDDPIVEPKRPDPKTDPKRPLPPKPTPDKPAKPDEPKKPRPRPGRRPGG
jgi:hypothetical protein